MGSRASSGRRTPTCSRSARCCWWRARSATCSARAACSPLGVAGFGVTSVFCALAPTVELLVVARALQGVFGALLTPAALAVIVATFPPDERGKAVGAWTAWGGIGTVLGPADRGAAGGHGILALDLRDQRPDRSDHALSRPARGARGAAAGGGREGGRDRRHALRAGPRRDHVRADRAAAAGVGRPDGRGAAARRGGIVRGVRGVGGAQPASDAAAVAVPAPQLRGRQHRDVLDVCRARPAVLLPGAVPPAGGGLQRARGRHDDDPRHGSSCSCSRPASARSPTATARASSWASGRWWRPPGSRSSCGSTRTSTT